MHKKHQKTLSKIEHRPVLGTILWTDIEKLLIALGAEVEERQGSRIAVIWHEEVRVFHRPHPEKETDKGAVIAVKAFIERHYKAV